MSEPDLAVNHHSAVHDAYPAQSEPEDGCLAVEGRQDGARSPYIQVSEPSTPQPGRLTRTVAIIKHHALMHRFDIEPRILEASFEIVKERQMEFDVETDPETLYELFGDDARSLGEGPVWVYVLERRRAVEVWNTLMGDRNPLVAREKSPNSLRALYGISLEQNGLMGSPDTQMAELQIASLFASSPPFPTTELPDFESPSRQSQASTQQSMSSTRLHAASETSSKTNRSTGSVPFRARPVPATHFKASIEPRSTKAAALRAGVKVEKKDSAPRAPLSKERLEQTFANVPGHKRKESIPVASAAPPVIPPRMTRAAALRLGVPPPLSPRARATTVPDGGDAPPQATFEGVPGHKRRESISVASTQAPKIAPRSNKSAVLRVQKDSVPPSSFMFRGPTVPKLPGLSRSSSRLSMNGSQPPTSTSRPASVAAMGSPSRPIISRTKSVSSAAVSSGDTSPLEPLTPKDNATHVETAKKVRRLSSVAPPAIAPKTNKSAALRAAKMAATEKAAAAKLGGKIKPAPKAMA